MCVCFCVIMLGLHVLLVFFCFTFIFTNGEAPRSSEFLCLSDF